MKTWWQCCRKSTLRPCLTRYQRLATRLIILLAQGRFRILHGQSPGEVPVLLFATSRARFPIPRFCHRFCTHLKRAAITRENVTVLIATGTHRPNLGDELVQLLGRELSQTLGIENHDCLHSEVRDFGTTPNGVPVKLNRTYTDADVKITVGLIEPHFMAGYSGGRKLIMPGIASLETVQAWHSPRFLEHENATAGITINNPGQ